MGAFIPKVTLASLHLLDRPDVVEGEGVPCSHGGSTMESV